jgi:hypothetical protein
VKGLVEWLSDLVSKDAPTVEPQPLPRDEWQRIRTNLTDASKKFAEAAQALDEVRGGAVSAELARDLEREAEALALRAHLLSRRAEDDDEEEKPKEADTRAKDEPETRTKDAEEKKDGQAHRERTPRRRTPDQLVRSAGNTVETAHMKVAGVAHPDAVAESFKEELDVLAEMTLSLRQRCRRLPRLPEQEEVAS